MDVYGDNLKVFSIFDGSLNSLVCCDLFVQRNKYTKNPRKKENNVYKLVYVDFLALEKALKMKNYDFSLASKKNAKFMQFCGDQGIENESIKLEEYESIQ